MIYAWLQDMNLSPFYISSNTITNNHIMSFITEIYPALIILIGKGF